MSLALLFPLLLFLFQSIFFDFLHIIFIISFYIASIIYKGVFMVAKVILFSFKYGEINNFLNSFYSRDLGLENFLSWQKEFSNPRSSA